MFSTSHIRRGLSQKGQLRRSISLLLSPLLALVMLHGQQASIVQTEVKNIPISPYLYGQNYWETPLPSSVWPLVKASGVKIIRIGGTNFNNNPPDDWALLDMVDDIRSAGAAPLVQVSSIQGPEKAAAMVRWLNVTNKRNVIFWEIGNEPNLSEKWLSDHTPDAVKNELNEAKNAAWVAGYIQAIAPAMRAVDGNMKLKIFGPGLSGAYQKPYLERWLGGVNDITAPTYIDGFTFHNYPSSAKNNPKTREELLEQLHTSLPKNLEKLTALMAAADLKHDRTGDDALTWGMSEFNITCWNPTPNDIGDLGTNSFLNGQFSAEYFALGMRYEAAFVNNWCIYENGDHTSPTDFGYLDGKDSRYLIPRSSYHHTKLMTQYFTGKYVPSTSTLKNMPAIVTRNNGQIAVMLLNEDLEAHDYVVQLNKDTIASAVDVKINVMIGMNKNFACTIGAQTTHVLIFSATDGHLVKRFRYSIGDNWNHKEPQLISTSIP